MEYFIAKWLHILSSTLLFGTGLGSAYYLFFASLTRDPRIVLSVVKYVVIADWLFTTTTIIFQPLSGLYLMQLMGIPLTSRWIVWSIALQEDAVFEECGRRTKSPANAVLAHVDQPEVSAPQMCAVDAGDVHAFRSQKADQMRAVGGERGVRVGGFHITPRARRAGLDRSLPGDLAAARVEAIHDPALSAVVVRAVAVSEQSQTQRRLA